MLRVGVGIVIVLILVVVVLGMASSVVIFSPHVVFVDFVQTLDSGILLYSSVLPYSF